MSTREEFEAWAKSAGYAEYHAALAAAHERQQERINRLRAALEDMTQWAAALAKGQNDAAYRLVMKSPRMERARAALRETQDGETK